MNYVIKVLISAILIVLIAEIAKRSSVLAGITASLPLTSLLAIVLLYTDTKDTERIAALSTSILWAVIPSLVFFIALPLLLRRGMPFATSMALTIGLTAGAYAIYVKVLNHFGISI